MYVRLAFAVAAHLEPGILVVDEVLAVGDVEFQKKYLWKIDEVSRREGRTVLVVSHNMGSLKSLCPRAIWLDHGSIRQREATRDVVNDYLAHGTTYRDRLVKLDELPRKEVEDEDRLRLECVEWPCDLPLRHGEPAPNFLENPKSHSGVIPDDWFFDFGGDTPTHTTSITA
jgi:ABC-type glutathione transport system ATPase component